MNLASSFAFVSTDWWNFNLRLLAWDQYNMESDKYEAEKGYVIYSVIWNPLPLP